MNSPGARIGATWYQANPEASTGPSTTNTARPLPSNGVRSAESAAPRGFERPRRPSVTTSAILSPRIAAAGAADCDGDGRGTGCTDGDPASIGVVDGDGRTGP